MPCLTQDLGFCRHLATTAAGSILTDVHWRICFILRKIEVLPRVDHTTDVILETRFSIHLLAPRMSHTFAPVLSNVWELMSGRLYAGLAGLRAGHDKCMYALVRVPCPRVVQDRR